MNDHDGGWPRRTPQPAEALPPTDWNQYAAELVDLANEMRDYARHFEQLRDPERACTYHHAAATYALAGAQAQNIAKAPAAQERTDHE